MSSLSTARMTGMSSSRRLRRYGRGSFGWRGRLFLEFFEPGVSVDSRREQDASGRPRLRACGGPDHQPGEFRSAQKVWLPAPLKTAGSFDDFAKAGKADLDNLRWALRFLEGEFSCFGAFLNASRGTRGRAPADFESRRTVLGLYLMICILRLEGWFEGRRAVSGR